MPPTQSPLTIAPPTAAANGQGELAAAGGTAKGSSGSSQSPSVASPPEPARPIIQTVPSPEQSVAPDWMVTVASPSNGDPEQSPVVPPVPAGVQTEHVGRNFSVMSLFQVLQRTGWIFKTESLVMPAVLDMIGGSAWLRGFLPMLNRFGQSIPPMMAAGVVRSTPVKKWWLAGTTGLMGVIFLLLAVLWQFTGRISPLFMSLAVLALYAVFFSATGINQLVQSSLQGKLIPVLRRGELMTFSSLIGSSVAVLCAWFLLNRWMSGNEADFTSIFTFTGVLFLLGAASAAFFRELPDAFAPTPFSLRGLAVDTVAVLKNDRPFRRVAITAALFGMMMTLFPHYQSLARTRLDLDLSSLVPWVIAQNLGVAVFSMPVGRITDRYGNRMALRFVMLGLCLAPVAALLLSWLPGVSEHWYVLVFGLLGLTPVTMRTFNNFTLELVDRSNQPRYLGILSLMMAGPAIVASVAVGLLIDHCGYEWAFAAVTACQVAGFAMTWRLDEPRHNQPAAAGKIPVLR